MDAGPRGVTSAFRHQVAFYESDRGFLDIVTPFLQQGVAAGEPTVAALNRSHATLVRTALPGPGVTYLPDGFEPDRPAITIKACQELFAGHVAGGAECIRLVGEVPLPMLGNPWDSWSSFESVINQAFVTFPLWGLYVYERCRLPPKILHQVERTHPYLFTADGGYVDSDYYQDPSRFMADRPRAAPEAIESDRPAVVLVQPFPVAARHAVAKLGAGSDVGTAEIDDLIVAVSEVVTNAILHGRPPTTLRAWADRGCVVVTVHDRGSGPENPFVGFLPTDKGHAEGGYGLWIAHQLCHRVSLDADDDGFTVRLVAATRPAPR